MIKKISSLIGFVGLCCLVNCSSQSNDQLLSNLNQPSCSSFFPDAGTDTSSDAGADAGSILNSSNWKLIWDARHDGLVLPSGLSITGSPTLDPYGIHGSPAVKLSVANVNIIRANSFVPLLSGNLTIAARIRRFGRFNPAAIFGFGATNPSQASTTYLEGRLSRGTGNSPEVASRATGSAEILLGPVASGISFADHVVVIERTSSGTTTTWEDGVLLSTMEMGVAPSGINELAFFGSPRGTTAMYDAFDGWVQTLAVADHLLSSTEVSELNNAWLAQDRFPKGSCPKVEWMGDSLTLGAQDRDPTGTLGIFAGFRYRTWEFARVEGLCFETFGTQNQGFFPEPLNGARSSYGVTAVAQQFEIEMARPESAGVDLISFLVGAGDFYGIALNPALLAPKMAAYRNLLERAHTLAPDARLMVSTVTPWDPSVTGASSCIPWNSALLTMLDQYDAAHPSQPVIRVDAFNAIGGVWNSTLWFDTAHLGPAGFDLEAPAFWTAMRPVISGLIGE
jgi:hypothetical protein